MKFSKYIKIDDGRKSGDTLKKLEEWNSYQQLDT